MVAGSCPVAERVSANHTTGVANRRHTATYIYASARSDYRTDRSTHGGQRTRR